ncbi:MAG TPA: hypothetical protein VGN44_07690 [Candidatus Angelobacter sp.]|jgi:hypothetical protein
MRSRIKIAGAMVAIFAFSLFAGAQTAPAVAPSACPVELTNLHVSDVSVHLKNISGKRIVGLVFNVALSDATERWIWMHWAYDLGRPLQQLGWNKEIKEGDSKKLSWGWNFEREHNGGVALCLPASSMRMAQDGRKCLTTTAACKSGAINIKKV